MPDPSGQPRSIAPSLDDGGGEQDRMSEEAEQRERQTMSEQYTDHVRQYLQGYLGERAASRLSETDEYESSGEEQPQQDAHNVAYMAALR